MKNFLLGAAVVYSVGVTFYAGAVTYFAWVQTQESVWRAFGGLTSGDEATGATITELFDEALKEE